MDIKCNLSELGPLIMGQNYLHFGVIFFGGRGGGGGDVLCLIFFLGGGVLSTFLILYNYASSGFTN